MATKEEPKPEPSPFDVCLKYLKYNLASLPTPYAPQESNKMTFIYFVVSSLDVMGRLDDNIINKEQVIDYIYSLQVLPHHSDEVTPQDFCGFRGSNAIGAKYNSSGHVQDPPLKYNFGHIAMTYTALCTLAILGDSSFSRLNKNAIAKALVYLQKEDGSFGPIGVESESDVRFIYCAAAISFMIGEWLWDVEKAIKYILSSQSYDGAIGQGPGTEAHSGMTYCALAALHLMGKSDRLPNRDRLVQWLLGRQTSGFQGRTNKPADSCYSYWIGASLTLLGVFGFVDCPMNRSFLMSCQHKSGGFAKYPDHLPDVLHTHFSLCSFSLMNEPHFLPLDCMLGITQRAAKPFYKN
eukprot:TRINITY_DN2064_c0_g1_i1.p1 TRINITY_DN2064_c0_g1~~TRINITY_DN2064_c0_g1_i1.p1  ORF type:complete len:351 (+),score=43.25 TRINITY_DN2064_c0_g1_i1:124-1176(+)